MTVEINLLPWREAQRVRRTQRFHMALGLVAVLGLGAGYGMSWYFQQQAAAQQQRNAHIQAQSRQLDAAISELRRLEEVREQMLEQVEVFAALQSGRAQTVHVMGELTASLVDGVHYVRFERQGDALNLSGMAENNWQVADQLRELEATEVFSEPVLSEVEATGSGEQRRFSLSMSQQMPSRKTEGEADEP